MKLEKAITLSLGSLDQSIFTAYELGLLLLRLYSKKRFSGEAINIQKDTPGMAEVSRYREKLKDAGILGPIRGLPEDKVFSVFGKSNFSTKEAVCVIDPFAYVSHLSAMEYHGISDRLPKVLFISSLPQVLWGQKAKEKMRKDYGEFTDLLYGLPDLPKLTRIVLEKIKGVSINRYQSKKIGSFISAPEGCVRVSSIGRTFLDMLREPSFCGGIRHVLDVYESNAKRYKKLILDEVDRHGNSIEKARAGYIMEEYCDISSPVMEEWAKNVTRGGSRKLDPNEAFSSEFSEKWCISINS